MKAVFLDIDGVLNNDYTEEKLFGDYAEEFTGLDKRLVEMFLKWIEGKDLTIVLSSTWRLWDYSRHAILDHGIRFEYETPKAHTRGREIEMFLSGRRDEIEAYVILDDLGPKEFLKSQRPYLIQTSPKHGLREKNLVRAERILKL